MKWVVWFLVLLNVALLAYFNLGGIPFPETLASRQPIQPEKIRLLTPDEIEVLPKKAGEEVPSPVAAPEPPKTACYEWGSFARNRLASAQQVMQAHALQVVVKDQTRQETLRYWVYLPPSSPEKAQQKMEEIQSLGIEESFLVQEPQWKNAISFGIFKDEQLANKLRDELKAKGVSGVQKAIRNQEKGRVSLIINNMPVESAAEIEKLKPDFPGSELKEINCQ